MFNLKKIYLHLLIAISITIGVNNIESKSQVLLEGGTIVNGSGATQLLNANSVFVKGNRIYCTSGNDSALSIFRLIKCLFN